MSDKKPNRVFDTAPPHGPYYSEPPDDDVEASPITDMQSMFRKTEKMERLLLRMAPPIARIPEVESKVDITSERVTRVEEKLEGQRARIEQIDSRVDVGRAHDCYQADVIVELKSDQKSIAEKVIDGAQTSVFHKARIAELEKDSEEATKDIIEIKKVPQKILYSVVTMIFSLLASAGLAVWFLAELSKDVEFERTQRTEQIKRIERQIKGVAKAADPAPVVKEVRVLQQTVEDSTKVETTYNDICKGMTVVERRALVRVLRRRSKAVPTSCIEP